MCAALPRGLATQVPGGSKHPADVMSIAVRVQHHPSRAHLIPALLERLDGFEDVQAVTDPGGPKPSSWRTHRLCLEAIPDAATHLLVVQDDAWPCERFAERAQAVIAAHPDRIVAFFVPGFGHMSRPMMQAARRGQSVMELRVSTFVPLVCVAYPREHAEAIPAFADERKMPVGRADDAVVGTYVRAHRLGALATVPSLVQHLDGEPSAMRMRHGTGRPHRVAALFADAS